MPYFRQLFGELGANGKYYLPSYRDSLITSILSAGTFVGALGAFSSSPSIHPAEVLTN